MAKIQSIRWADDLRSVIEQFASENGINFSTAVSILIRKGVKRVQWEKDIIQEHEVEERNIISIVNKMREQAKRDGKDPDYYIVNEEELSGEPAEQLKKLSKIARLKRSQERIDTVFEKEKEKDEMQREINAKPGITGNKKRRESPKGRTEKAKKKP